MRRVLMVGLVLGAAALLFFAATQAGLLALGEPGGDPVGEADDEPGPDDSEDDEPDGEQEPPEPEPEPEPDIRTISLVAAGDITAHMPQINLAYVGDGRYDFSPSFEKIAPYLKRADLAVGNLETAQAGPEITFWNYTGYTGYPCFNAPLELSEALKEAGFDLVSFAHNHSLDRGLKGLQATLENVRGVGLTTFGAHLNEEEKYTPVIKEVDGVRVAFLAYTFSTNAIPIPEGHEYAVNFIENFHTVDPIAAEIQRARDAGADFVAVSMHWGEMYVTEPQPPRLREVARDVAEAGADLILGGHPHVVQPMEWFKFQDEEGSERVALVTYSMGNFLSNQRYPVNPIDLVQYGKLLQFEISKDMDSGETWLSGVDYEITWVHREWGHRILPLSEVLSGDPSEFNLTEGQVEALRPRYYRNKEIIDKYGFSEDAPPHLRHD